MSYNTIIEQGSFIATGTTSSTVIAPVTIKTDIGPDWVEVWNYTQFGNGSNPANTGFRFYWQKGMPNFSALSDAQLTINNKAVSAYKLLQAVLP